MGIARARWFAVASLTVAVAAAVVGGSTTAVAPLVAVFVLLCPGLALVGTLRLRDPLFELVLGVALSISIAGLVATVELFTHTWAPMPTLGLLLAVTATGLLLDRDLVPRALWAGAFDRLAGALRGLRGRSSKPRPTGAGAPTVGAPMPTAVAPVPMDRHQRLRPCRPGGLGKQTRQQRRPRLRSTSSSSGPPPPRDVRPRPAWPRRRCRARPRAVRSSPNRSRSRARPSPPWR